MKITVEKPITWLNSKRDGERNRFMYSSILQSLKELNVIYSETPVKYGNDFLPRTPPEDGLLLSYHSVGNVKNVWRLKETPIPYFYCIDRLGYSGWSELSIHPEIHLDQITKKDKTDAKSYCVKLAEWLNEKNLSKYRQTDKLVNLPESPIFFPMQMRRDAVSIHNHLDPLDVLKWAAEYAKKSHINLLVKRHPYCRNIRTSVQIQRCSLFNKNVFITDASVNQILTSCKCVLVGNSGVGLEALVHGKPVYSFASSEYELAIKKITSREDIESIFNTSDAEPDDIGYQFVYYYLTECCFDVRNINDIKDKISRAISETENNIWIK